ncbi:MAG: S8 family serine peptidase [Tateyamaria sp.]
MPTSKTIAPNATESNVSTLSLANPDLVLTTGTPDGGKYGNKYDGATAEDVSISAVFARTGVDLELTFDAFDVDQDNEIQVFLNGTLLGSVKKGVNEGLTGQTFLIPAGDQQPGNNLLTFEQTFNNTWKWGVTNVMVAQPGTTVADMALDIGVRDTGKFGNKFDGASDADGVVTATFTGGVEELELTFDAFDIDSNGEVEVLLNGVSLAAIAKGINNGFSEQVITIPLADQLVGENTLTFEQTVNNGYKWGVTNVMVATPGAADAPIPLTLGQIETGKYGNKYDGATDTDGEIAMTFESTGKPMLLEFDAFDIDSTGEVEVYVNGTLVGPVSVGLNNALSAKTFLIGVEVQQPGTNEITFVQAEKVSFKWGVTNVVIDEAPDDIAEMILDLGVMETGSYGNKFNGTSDTDGEVKALFQGGNEDLLLTFDAYDLDHKGEVEVFLNGTSFAKLNKGKNNALEQQSFVIKAADQLAGINEITFEQTRDNTFKWGVTNVEIDVVPETYTPSDPDFADQWHLKAAGDIEKVWVDYTGTGVAVAVYDKGIDTSHTELDGNYDASKHVTIAGAPLDAADGDGTHGTAVAGIIAAEQDNDGIVGVAFDSGVTGVNIIDGPASASAANLTKFGNAMMQMDSFDVVNHSWGLDPGFSASDAAPDAIFSKALPAFENAAENGRGGLGTVIVKSAGNAAANSNGDQMDGSRFSISVGAVTEENEVASYSNHGSNIFVSAPSAGGLTQANSGILTTDVTGAGGFQPGNYTGTTNLDGFGGTSASAPFVAGTVALMLDANETLGWRDVQNILAYSSTHTGKSFGPQPSTPLFDFENDRWQFNGADNWNGGGLHFSEDYGYGQVNVFNAVRMAEVWSLFGNAQVSSNEATHQITDDSGVNIKSGLSKQIALDTTGVDMIVENVQVTLALNDNTVNVFLVSEAGTRVALYRSGEAANGAMTWTFGAEGFRGETLEGTWMLDIFNKDGAKVTLTEYTVDWFGSDPSLAGAGDDVYHYTDEMFDRLERETKNGDLKAIVEDTSRTTLNDTDGGVDWLNFAAMTGDLSVDLSDGGVATSAGRQFIDLVNGSEIERAVGGDGRDTFIGNAKSNVLMGMRGDDTLSGGGNTDDLSGGAGDDTLNGDAGDDTLLGEKGADTLNGGSGADTLFGGNGADVLNGDDGDDELVGGAGADVMRGGNGNDLMQGEDGADTMFGEAGDDTIEGGAGSDYLDGGTEADTLLGGAGNDTLIGGDGDDVLNGGAGIDTVVYDGSAATVDLTQATAQVIGLNYGSDTLSGIENVTGGSAADNLTGDNVANVLDGRGGDDSLSGNGGDDQLLGGSGNDVLNGGSGLDALDGGSGDDILNGGDDADTLNGGDNNDTLDGGLKADILNGGSGNDILIGDAGSDTLNGDGGADDLSGGNGDDAMNGGSGSDTMDGGNGNDTMNGGSNDDVMTGGIGDDTMDGDGGNDTLSGGAGLDVLLGDGGDDTLNGEDDNDSLSGGSGADTLNGGLGDDTLNGDDDDDILNGDEGVDTMDGGLGNDTLNGGAGADVMNGGDGDDIMDGGTEDDQMLGGTGNDTMNGGDGNDTLTGEAGNDSLSGDAGNDTLSGGQGLDTLNGGSGDDTLNGGADNDTLNGGDGVDNLSGEDGDDTLSGDAGNDTLSGGAGLDMLNGGLGDDTLNGGGNNDTLNGDAGADALDGGNGDDNLNGGADNDTLSGGAGTDALNGDDGNDIMTGGTGADGFEFALGGDADRITDFTLSGAEEDDIELYFGATLTFNDLTISDDGSGNALIDMGGGDTLTLDGVDHTLLTQDHFSFFDV